MDTSPVTPETWAAPPARPEEEHAGLVARFARCIAHESTPRDMQNLKRFLAWMVTWAVVAIPSPARFGFVEDETSWFTLLQSGLVLVAVAGVIAAVVRYVRETDELNRRIQLTSLSIGFGAGFLASEVGEAAQHAGLIQRIDEDLTVLAMLVSYAVASALLALRYR